VLSFISSDERASIADFSAAKAKFFVDSVFDLLLDGVFDQSDKIDLQVML